MVISHTFHNGTNMSRFEELLARQVTNQLNNNTKVLFNGRTWFTYPTPGQPNSTEPFVNAPEGTFQPTLDSGNTNPQDSVTEGLISEARKVEYDRRYKSILTKRRLRMLYNKIFEKHRGYM